VEIGGRANRLGYHWTGPTLPAGKWTDIEIELRAGEQEHGVWKISGPAGPLHEATDSEIQEVLAKVILTQYTEAEETPTCFDDSGDDASCVAYPVRADLLILVEYSAKSGEWLALDNVQLIQPGP
jgi:hypothetical protein